MHTIDAAYIHLLVNHLPIILTLVGAIAAVLAIATRRRAVWLYALASLTISGASAYPVMLTGHAAEDVMKDKWYVTHDAIDEHEEAGETAMWVLIVMGAVSAYAWWRLVRRDTGGVLPLWLGAAVLVLSLAGVATTTLAAYRGGNIVYYSPKLAAPPPLAR
jgi:hypothetical protein